MSLKIRLVLVVLVAGILFSGRGDEARAAPYPIPFDPFLTGSPSDAGIF